MKLLERGCWRRLLPAKLLLVMRITTVLLFIATLHVSARGISQTVTYSGKNVRLEKVFAAIKQQTGYVFFYRLPDLADAKPVSVDLKNVPLQDALEKILKDQSFNFSIQGNTIVITLKTPVAVFQHGDTSRLPLPKIIRAHGVVYDESGRPLAGANITIKETGHGTVTNAKGEYTLSDVVVNSTLIISFTGFAPQQIKVVDDSPIQVYLSITRNELDKAVVQAYGNTSQRLSTGNIGTVSAAEIERQPTANILSAIEGKVAGLVVTPTNGYASAPFKVEIRGRSSIDPNRPSEPLYIIDGVPLTILENPNGGGNYGTGSTGFLQGGVSGPAGGQSPLFSLNPNDIESISVLKDGDATAIYGSRGANGVIIITTKSGKPGKTIFTANGYQGISAVTRRYKMLNTQQYLSLRREAFKNDNIVPDLGSAYDLLSWDTTKYTDWQKYLWGGTAKTSDLQTTISGGDKQTTFRLSGTYHRETDILTISGANQRVAVQSNLSHKSLNQKLVVGLTSTYSFAKLNLISLPGNSLLPPDAPAPFDKNGNLDWKSWDPIGNPFNSLLTPYTSKTSFLNSRITVQYEVFKGFTLSSKLGYSTTHVSQMSLNPITSQNPIYNPTGSSTFGNNNNTNTIIEPQLEYKTALSMGTLNVLIGASTQTVQQDANRIDGSGYLNDNLLQSISNAPIRSAGDANFQYKYAAVFGRVTYNWQNKYIANISARRDGSSRFGPGKQFGNFGALGIAWIFTEESFAKKYLSWLSFGKLRSSYGITGSDLINDYNYLTSWASNNSVSYIPGTPAYTATGHANPDLQWQVDKKWEGALDLGFFKDKLTFELAYYQNRCGNQLLQVPLPIQTGFNIVSENLLATVQNTGIESLIKATVIENRSFNWSINFNIGVNRNKLIAFPNLSQSPYSSAFTVGKSLNITKLLHYTGVDPQTGVYTFEDKNHDGNININPNDTANDLYGRDLSVKFEGGFGTDFKYKGFQLDLFFHYRQRDVQGIIASLGYGGASNTSSDVFNRWQKPGDKAMFAKYTTGYDQSYANFYVYSDGVYTNGFFVRLQNISLSYELSSRALKSMHLNGCKFYLHCQNAFLFTKYRGVDPENPSFGSMPISKIFTAGIELSL